MVDNQAVLLCLVSEFNIVIIASTGFAVRVLPGVEKFVQENAQDLPELARVQVASVYGDLATQAEAIMAVSVMAKAPSSQVVDAEGDGGDFEFKLDIEDLRPTLEFSHQVSAFPVLVLLMLGESTIDGRGIQAVILAFDASYAVQVRIVQQ